MLDPQINWDKIPDSSTKAPNPSTKGSKIDWDKLPDQSKMPTSTISASEHPVADRMGQIIEDIKHGPGVNDDRLFPSILRGIGFHGLESGAGPVGSSLPFASAPLGAAELIHAGTRIPQVNSEKSGANVVNEGLGGLFKTLPLAGLAAPSVLPLIAPGMTLGGTVQGGVQSGAEKLGLDPDNSELLGNAAAMAIPGTEKAGKLIENNSGKIGKGVGGATAAYEMIKHPSAGTAAAIALGIHPGSKIASHGAAVVGKTMRQAGELGRQMIDIPKPDEVHPDYEIRQANDPAPPLQLERGSLITPPPTDIPTQAVPAQAQVVRGKGGRMVKQFTAEPSSGSVQMNPGRIPSPNFGEPQAPPPVFAPEAAQPTVNPQIEKPLIQTGPEPQPESQVTSPTEKPLTQTQEQSPQNLPTEKSPKFDVENRTPIIDDKLNQIGETHNSESDMWDQVMNDPRYGRMPLYATMDESGKFTGITGDPESGAALDNETIVQLTDEEGKPISGAFDINKQNPQVNELQRMFDQPDNRLIKSPKDIDEKDLQQDYRNQFDNDQQSADELGRKIFYRDNKVDTGKITNHQYDPGDVDTLLPWADTPWGNKSPKKK